MWCHPSEYHQCHSRHHPGKYLTEVHHADIIVRAEREVFLATNYWEASSAAHTLTDAFRELSRRAQARGGPKVVVKIMYDRGNPSQMISPHQSVDAKTYTGDKVKLPRPDEVPGLELEVQNYHVPPVGTFHSKYMVVDRKIAILNSNNIQDRVNVEMMTHIEGPIVQSFYDMALQSWSNPMSPPLPLLSSPPSYPENPSQQHYSFGQDHPVLSGKADLDQSAGTARDTLAQHHADTEQHGNDDAKDSGKGKWDSTNDDEAKRVDSQFSNEQAITEHLNTGSKIKGSDSSPPPNAEKFRPIILHKAHDPAPMALVNRPPRGRPGHGDTYVPQDQAWLAGFKFAKKSVFIQTPTFNAIPIVEAAIDAVKRGILVEIYADLGFNDEGELLPFQGGTNQMVSTAMYGRLSPDERKLLKIYWYTGKDQKTPLNAKDKADMTMFLVVDSHIGIQGNGNQDAQSWFHSQEINVLLDSTIICQEWREAIDSNQNTVYYGLVDSKDGVWRDSQGKELPGVPHYPSGPMKNLVGVKGAIDRVRGEGGF
ncbi:hypothetical protein BCR39DRAFT_563820 [Naematelia encephala]|uniref:PLD phosphodiesterase domain-containing protein n=1 Tax=Naematelia encephala TaxID=71784 RepID=A0A1Y2BGI3_9TREE|nr:hypothetical protein BCR39DRAFT_563820 [Naematelia encephala]